MGERVSGPLLSRRLLSSFAELPGMASSAPFLSATESNDCRHGLAGLRACSSSAIRRMQQLSVGCAESKPIVGRNRPPASCRVRGHFLEGRRGGAPVVVLEPAKVGGLYPAALGELLLREPPSSILASTIWRIASRSADCSSRSRANLSSWRDLFRCFLESLVSRLPVLAHPLRPLDFPRRAFCAFLSRG